PPALVALQHLARAGVEAEPRRIDDRFGERGDVAQPHVEALAGDRMDDVGGVADEREALADEGARYRISQRMHAARADDLDLAELEPEPALELGVKHVIRQGDDLFRGLRIFGPYDRGTTPLERQDRERTGGQKMLARAPLVIALVRHIGHDRRLRIGPA